MALMQAKNLRGVVRQGLNERTDSSSRARFVQMSTLYTQSMALSEALRALRLSIMFLETAACIPENGTVVPRSSDTFVAGTGAAAGAGTEAAGGFGVAAAVTSTAAKGTTQPWDSLLALARTSLRCH